MYNVDVMVLVGQKQWLFSAFTVFAANFMESTTFPEPFSLRTMTYFVFKDINKLIASVLFSFYSCWSSILFTLKIMGYSLRAYLPSNYWQMHLQICSSIFTRMGGDIIWLVDESICNNMIWVRPRYNQILNLDGNILPCWISTEPNTQSRRPQPRIKPIDFDQIGLHKKHSKQKSTLVVENRFYIHVSRRTRKIATGYQQS
jgi:hypothetical protein